MEADLATAWGILGHAGRVLGFACASLLVLDPAEDTIGHLNISGHLGTPG